MNTRRLISTLLLVLTLLAVQSSYAVHSHDDAASGGDETCELCLHSAKFDSFKPAAASIHAISRAEWVCVRSRQTTYQTLSVRCQNPRAPPRT